MSAVAGRLIRQHLRDPVALVAVLAFAVGALVLVQLGFAGASSPPPREATAGLWIVVLFGALIAFERSSAAAISQPVWDTLLAAPVSRLKMLCGLGASALVFALAVHLPLLVVWFAVVRAPESVEGAAVVTLAVLLADVGVATLGVLAGSIARRARHGSLVGIVVLLPTMIPLLLAGMTASLAGFGATDVADPTRALVFLVGYDTLFAVLAVGLFPELAPD